MLLLLMTLISCGRTRVASRLADQRGQTSAEYALVLFGAASVAMLVAFWAKDTDKIGALLDTIFDTVVKMVG